MKDYSPERSRRMLKSKRAKTILTPSPFKVALLLCQYILTWIGQIPIKLLFPKRHRGRPKKIHIPLWAKITIIPIGSIIIISTYTWAMLSAAYQLPTPQRLAFSEQPLTSQFYDRDGKLLYRLYESRNRLLIPLQDLPPYLLQATIAIEDKNFYKHNGVDFLAIARALYNNFSQDQLEGASTITQQLVKNSLLTPEKTYSRKFKEIVLSVWAESIYSKPQILSMYLNNAPYGGTNWGVEAASQNYFGKSAQDLTLAEASYLAGLPASPSLYSPLGSRADLGKVRQKEVLDRMVENKYISRGEAEEAYKQVLQFIPQLADLKAAHFVMYTKSLLESKYGTKMVSQGGLKVITSLDLGLQEEVEKIVSEEVNNLSSLNVSNGAAMVTDPKTGQILAMVGSKDYHNPGFGNYNVTTALRQPGSSIKPVTYVTAFKKGYSPGNTILDTPVTFSDQWGNSYSPVNYDGAFHGPVSIRTALASSLNIPAVKMLATIGVDPVIQTAKDLGITTFTDPKRYGLSLTLGGAAIKMVDMMSVYGAFSQMGIVHPITPILQVTDPEGNVLEQYRDRGQQMIQRELTFMITSILTDDNARTLAFGPNSLLNIRGVASKTGTTDSKKDNWAFGYTPEFVVGVWVGNNDNSPMDPSLTSGITGATPIWNRITRGLLSANPNTDFNKPSGIVDVVVDGRRDITASGILPKALVQVRADKDQTRYFDSFSSFATSTASLKDSSSN